MAAIAFASAASAVDLTQASPDRVVAADTGAGVDVPSDNVNVASSIANAPLQAASIALLGLQLPDSLRVLVRETGVNRCQIRSH